MTGETIDPCMFFLQFNIIIFLTKLVYAERGLEGITEVLACLGSVLCPSLCGAGRVIAASIGGAGAGCLARSVDSLDFGIFPDGIHP